MEIKLHGWVHGRPDGYGPKEHQWKGLDLSFFAWEDMKQQGFILLAPAVVTFEIPDNYDPRASLVEALKIEEQRITAEFQEKVTAIHAQINRYMALEA